MTRGCLFEVRRRQPLLQPEIRWGEVLPRMSVERRWGSGRWLVIRGVLLAQLATGTTPRIAIANGESSLKGLSN
jgi:hypothetical protein